MSATSAATVTARRWVASLKERHERLRGSDRGPRQRVDHCADRVAHADRDGREDDDRIMPSSLIPLSLTIFLFEP